MSSSPRPAGVTSRRSWPSSPPTWCAAPTGSPCEPELRGAKDVAEETSGNAVRARFADLALVDGDVGLVLAQRGRLFMAIRLTIQGERITDIDVIGEPDRLHDLDLAVLD